jgi:UDP-4-amino-4,6-dideoxy-N-acetyl-beta-L-altrosamine transaminase
MIPYGRQEITQADIDAVVSVLHSDFLTQGPQVPEFERLVKEYTSAKYGIAVNSATSALHIACLALGLSKGDWLWTTPITFVASANCALYCGANVDFVDIDPYTYNLSVSALEQRLLIANREGKLPKIVIAVHLCGQPCDMKTIATLSHKYGFRVIEDASHAIGAKYNNEYVGSGQYSDITIFSFHPVKIITTAEGGIALTNDKKLADRMTLLRNHGITRDPNEMTVAPDGPWYYQQTTLGFNYRLTDIQAALGISQLQRLNTYIEKRQQLAERYCTLLANIPVTLPWVDPQSTSAWHLFVIRLRLDNINKTHLEVFKQLRARNIGVNLHYIPVYRQPYYQRMGFQYADFPEAEQYYAEAISLPLFATMTLAQQDTVIEALHEVLA